MKQNPLNITNSVFFSPTDTQEISKLITSLKKKAKKSSGHDDLSSWLLKTLSAEVTEPLCYLVNKSLEEGIMPYKLKIAKVIPICKAKERNQLKNYRPISPLSSISKIFEKVVFKRLYTFINEKLYPRQYGFRQKHYTMHAVTEFHNDIINSFENRQKTIATFLDLSKAFDTLDHDVLLKKHEKYGVEAYPSTGLKVTLVIEHNIQT